MQQADATATRQIGLRALALKVIERNKAAQQGRDSGMGKASHSVSRRSALSDIVATAPAAPQRAATRPANWREVMAAVGYQVKGRRATCPLCPPEKTGLAVSVTSWGVNCFRDRTHSRSWAAILSTSSVPGNLGKRSHSVRRPAVQDPERVRAMLAREAAAYDWTFARPASEDHTYLAAKRIPPMGAREDAKGRLLVPVYGLGRMGIEILFSLERIRPDGAKRFEADCRTKGGYCFVRPDWERMERPRRLGPVPEPEPKKVWVCEGFATAATVCLATNDLACCIFSAGNLAPTLEVLPRRMRSTEFIIAADNDRETPGNPGLKAALEAAKRFHLRVTCPEFPDGAQGSDWNDLAAMLDAREDGGLET